MARIAFLIPNLAGGGAERVALTLANEFAERGHDVDLLVMERRGELVDEVPTGVRLIDLKAPRIRAAFRPLIRYLREHRPHAIQVSLWPLTIAGIIAARFARVHARIVVSDHISLSRQFGSEELRFALLKLTTRIFYPLADARICVSAGSGGDLARLSGLPARTITVVHNPVPAPARSRDVDRQALWRDAKARFLTVGTLKDQKNHALLIDSFAKVARKLDARLIIVGDGPLRAALELQVDRLGLRDRVHLAGYVPDPSPYYASANVFVLSSDYEGFALVLVEALHQGLRIVSTDCPDGPAEILCDGRFGRLVPVGDAAALANAMVAEMASTRDPRIQRKRAADFSPEKAADAYLDALLGHGHGGKTVADLQFQGLCQTGD